MPALVLPGELYHDVSQFKYTPRVCNVLTLYSRTLSGTYLTVEGRSIGARPLSVADGSAPDDEHALHGCVHLDPRVPRV
jgi:hypothetical protein